MMDDRRIRDALGANASSSSLHSRRRTAAPPSDELPGCNDNHSRGLAFCGPLEAPERLGEPWGIPGGAEPALANQPERLLVQGRRLIEHLAHRAANAESNPGGELAFYPMNGLGMISTSAWTCHTSLPFEKVIRAGACSQRGGLRIGGVEPAGGRPPPSVQCPLRCLTGRQPGGWPAGWVSPIRRR
jgi:hypothetical protein